MSDVQRPGSPTSMHPQALRMRPASQRRRAEAPVTALVGPASAVAGRRRKPDGRCQRSGALALALAPRNEMLPQPSFLDGRLTRYPSPTITKHYHEHEQPAPDGTAAAKQQQQPPPQRRRHRRRHRRPPALSSARPTRRSISNPSPPACRDSKDQQATGFRRATSFATDRWTAAPHGAHGSARACAPASKRFPTAPRVGPSSRAGVRASVMLAGRAAGSWDLNSIGALIWILISAQDLDSQPNHDLPACLGSSQSLLVLWTSDLQPCPLECSPYMRRKRRPPHWHAANLAWPH
eukprot:356777-Chlamydomonas_euryale.AAC.3